MWVKRLLIYHPALQLEFSGASEAFLTSHSCVLPLPGIQMLPSMSNGGRLGCWEGLNLINWKIDLLKLKFSVQNFAHRNHAAWEDLCLVHHCIPKAMHSAWHTVDSEEYLLNEERQRLKELTDVIVETAPLIFEKSQRKRGSRLEMDKKCTSYQSREKDTFWRPETAKFGADLQQNCRKVPLIRQVRAARVH